MHEGRGVGGIHVPQPFVKGQYVNDVSAHMALSTPAFLSEVHPTIVVVNSTDDMLKSDSICDVTALSKLKHTICHIETSPRVHHSVLEVHPQYIFHQPP